jgi:hypothetical protein
MQTPVRVTSLQGGARRADPLRSGSPVHDHLHDEMQQIEATYLAQLDGVVFDLQVGRDNGDRMLVLGSLVEVFEGEGGAIDSFRPIEQSENLRDDLELLLLDQDELEALATRRRRIAILAGNLLGISFDHALRSLTAT